MTTQPEALRLADALMTLFPTRKDGEQAADELRRLHAENEELWKEREEPHKTIEMYVRECNRLERERDEARRTVREAHEAGTRLTAQRDALLEALQWLDKWMSDKTIPECVWKVRAAIKAVEEGENHAKNL